MMPEEQTRESNSLREFITKLGFELKNGSNNFYQKYYSKCNKTLEIELKTDISKSIIHYQNIGITCDRDTTCDFHHEENKVVLECVNRLLDIGKNMDSNGFSLKTPNLEKPICTIKREKFYKKNHSKARKKEK
jgi:hypothetical protein